MTVIRKAGSPGINPDTMQLTETFLDAVLRQTT